MKLKYIDFIHQSFDFPQEGFNLKKNHLEFHGIPLQKLIKKHGTPLKISYLPKISENIQRAKKWFEKAIKKTNYKGKYHYCYCTKSAHFSFILKEALSNDIHIETSSAYDLHIIDRLHQKQQINASIKILCNGYKTEEYLENILSLKKKGFDNILPIIDNVKELSLLEKNSQDMPMEIGIRIASEEEPRFDFYTSRLGIGYRDVIRLYKDHILYHKHLKLTMLHFFINTGIRDTAYYWNEFNKCLRVYAILKKICPSLNALNIGGGFPIKNSLSFDYDYASMVNEIIQNIQKYCSEAQIEEPDIYTEFGSFTVGESGAMIFNIIDQKKQNDREKWNMIDGSFMTTLPDSWAINKRFMMLPINGWEQEYERVFLGGLTCDSDDYYNAEQHINAIYLPKYRQDKPLYIGFFNTGAYQENISGYGGLKHCLIPDPKHIIISKNTEGTLQYKVFNKGKDPKKMLKLLGY